MFDQYSAKRKFSEFLLLFTFKAKMNFGSLFKYFVNFMQPSVLNIASGNEESLRHKEGFGVKVIVF